MSFQNNLGRSKTLIHSNSSFNFDPLDSARGSKDGSDTARDVGALLALDLASADTLKSAHGSRVSLNELELSKISKNGSFDAMFWSSQE